MALQARHGFASEDVDRVEVIAPPLIVRLVGRELPSEVTATYARLCIGYAVGKALQFGKLDLAHFRGDALADPATHALAARVETRSDGSSDQNALAPQTVIIRLNSGGSLRWDCASMLASPDRRLAQQEHLTKFDRCCTFATEPLVRDAPAQLVEVVSNLEVVEDLGALLRLIASPHPHP